MSNCGWHLKYRPRYPRSKGAVLLLLWNMLLFGYFGAVLNIISSLVGPSFSQKHQLYTTLIAIAIQGFFNMLKPIGGWLADVYFGRHRTVRYCMRIVWIGMVFLVIQLLLKYSLNPRNKDTVFNQVMVYGVSPIVFVVINLGLAGFDANMIPFAMDQLQDAPGEEISSFVHWYYWTTYLGFGFVTYYIGCASADSTYASLLQTLVATFGVSLALVLDTCCGHWLQDEPCCKDNPYTLVLRVVEYAMKTKSPARRSALTYWESEPPSRFDLGKARYGGPFSTNQVEDVKTMLQIFAVLLVTGGTMVVRLGAGNSLTMLAAHLSPDPHVSSSLPSFCTGPGSVLNVYIYLIIVGVPVNEVLIYPLFQRVFPSMFARLGIGILLAMVCVLSLDIIDTVGHYTTSDPVPCLFHANKSAATLDISRSWISIPYFLYGLAMLFLFIALFEFICAQTPISMRGMVIGLSFGIHGAFYILYALLILIFYQAFASDPTTSPSCGFWYYLTNLAIVGSILVGFCLVARMYKGRRRDDPDREHQYMFVEEYYEKVQYSPSISTHETT